MDEVAYWIVRCNPAHTLPLTKTLLSLGFDAWTPTVERQYRKARSKKYIRVPEPMLSSFIFVAQGENPIQCAERLDDLRWMHGLRVWRVNGNYAPVSAERLEPMRLIEREAQTFGIDNVVKPDNFEIGMRGTVVSDAFLGITCTLVDRSRNNLLVLLDGATTPITVKAALFRPVEK